MGEFKKQQNLGTAVALIVGQVIAVGIFLTPAGMAKSVGSPFWLFIVWIFVGLLTLAGALCYGELAARFPEAGGSYVFLREAFGKRVAFLYGWMVLLVLDPGLTAIFAVGLAAYSGFLVELSPVGQKALAIGVVLAIGLTNIAGARISAGILRALTVLKVGTLLCIIILGFGGGFGQWANFRPFFAIPEDPFAAFAGGIVGAFFAFAGWWEVTRIAGEVKDPTRTLPLALAIGVVAITMLYALTSAVFLYLVPPSGVTSDETFAAQAGTAMFGPAGGAVFAAIVVASVVGTLFAYLMVSPRVYYAMARDGLFFRSFAELHPRFGTPHRGTLVQIVLASALIATGTFSQILGYFFFIVVLFVALSVAGLFRLRRQEFAGYKTPFYPLTPIFFLALTAVVLMLIAMRSPLETAVGTGIVLSGIPIYRLARL
jgi:APA family basic amino acid/polyamine antiporter